MDKRFIDNTSDIAPDEIFLDSSNLPEFNTHQFEGRMERPISFTSIRILGLLAFVVLIAFGAKLFSLQVVNGETFHRQSEENRLMHSTIFAERGSLTDRNDKQLAWSSVEGATDTPKRYYTDIKGLGHLLGYAKPPARDKQGFFYRTYFEGVSGGEALFDNELRGVNGTKIIEADVHNEIISQSLIEDPKPGEDIRLSIDAEINEKLFESIKNATDTYGYSGGASVIMDIETGEVLALTSYPETDPSVMSKGQDDETISEYSNDPRNPYLNRALGGVFTPGSIVKPFIAAGILNENLINPLDNILSDGVLEVENPYNSDVVYTYRDWQAHGLVDMRDALAVSSDQYFYVLGGGYKDIEGLGIDRIEHYMRLFGFGEGTGMQLGTESTGVVPSREWKSEVFDENWYIGNTYHTAIGQYGFLVTPIQAVQATASIANGGTLITPRISDRLPLKKQDLNLEESDLQVIVEGMRMAVEDGTAVSLSMGDLAIAAKTGTAEVGAEKGFENSWVIGFFPYENPKYAFATVLEHAPEEVSFGAAPSMRSFFEWLVDEKNEYIR